MRAIQLAQIVLHTHRLGVAPVTNDLIIAAPSLPSFLFLSFTPFSFSFLLFSLLRNLFFVQDCHSPRSSLPLALLPFFCLKECLGKVGHGIPGVQYFASRAALQAI